MLANTEESRKKLAQHVIDGWDVEDLINFAVKTLTDEYKDVPALFHDDVEHYGFEGVE